MAHSGTKSSKMRKIHVKDLNDILICTLCNGYLIDATTLMECLHVFCRGCILKYFENCKTGCPSCDTVFKKKNQQCILPDPQVQALVYKLVPGLYSKEMQRREDFYRSTGVRASSSCSDDSVLERERDMINDQESLISSYVGDKAQFFGPEDSISLSMSYYHPSLDKTQVDDAGVVHLEGDINANKQIKLNGSKGENKDSSGGDDGGQDPKKTDDDRRYLQCPAGVSMRHLQKFVRMKYALTANHRVDIIYEGEVLPDHFSLMDVAYTFKWNRLKPMRFFYRIFTPLKIQPIKIVNTTLSTGGKQLQIVPVKSSLEPPTKPPPPVPEPPKSDAKEAEESKKETEEKERLLANLQLQSKSKVQSQRQQLQENTTVPDKVQTTQQPTSQDCVFEYEEPDKEEIKRFAEIRDREWALQKKLDESRQDSHHHFSKKRKKSKHSKNDFTHKKRKLHAEITNKEEELKLKVKLTQHNGHKHKHHKSSSQNATEMSSKEKILQMRQVRHKHVTSEDKNVQTVPSGSVSKETGTSTENLAQPERLPLEVKEKSAETHEKPHQQSNGVKPAMNSTDEVNKPVPVEVNSSAKTLRSDFALKTSIKKEWGNRVPTVQIERHEQAEKQAKSFQSYVEKYQKNLGKVQNQTVDKNVVKLPPVPRTPTTPAATVVPKPPLSTNKIPLTAPKPTVAAPKPPIAAPNPTVAAPKPVVSSHKPQISAPQPAVSVSKVSLPTSKPTMSAPRPASTGPKLLIPPNRPTLSQSLDRKIASLQQRCTIEPKPLTSNHDIKKPPVNNEKPKLLNPQCPPGFTVSKIEAGVKRKSESECSLQSKRPSLEITRIYPPSDSKTPPVPQPAKRPPPATIPLDRIKKSINLKSGISIIPKLPEKCDNIGALDLSSKPGTKMGEGNNNATDPSKIVNGYSIKDAKNINMSNLQMLSKVAMEHPNLNKTGAPKPRPQMPNLQTIKIPSLQNAVSAMANNKPCANLAKLPKLTEISKTNYRMLNPPLRALRPNQNHQNQSIRNIPNPSLLVRQNQNRLNCLNSSKESGDSTKDTSTPPPPTTTTAPTAAPTLVVATTSPITSKTVVAATPPPETAPKLPAVEVKAVESKEISV